MKKLVACLMILSATVFTVGCGKTEPAKTTSAKTGSEMKTDDGGAAPAGTKTDDGGTVGEKTEAKTETP